MKIPMIMNKVIALVFIGSSILLTWLSGEGTMLVFSLMVGIPLFFSKKNWIE